MIDQLKTWLQTDNRAKIKLAFILGVTVFLISLLTLLVYLNTQQLNNSDTPTSQNSSSSEFSSSQNNQEEIDSANDSLEDNLRARIIERVGESQVSSLVAPIFDDEGSIIFTDINGRVYKNDELVSDQNRSYPISTYLFKNNIILNEGDNVVVVDLETNQSRRLPEKFYNLIPVGDFVFSLELVNGNEFIVNRYTSIPQTGNESNIFIGSGQIEQNNNFFELRRLGNSFVIFNWKFGVQRGEVDIYQVSSNKIEFISSIENIIEFKIFNNLVIISLENSRDLNTYDFTDAQDVGRVLNNAFTYEINFFLRQNSLNEDISPKRCDLKENDILYCLVKSDLDSQSDDIFSPDEIIQINLLSGEVDKVFNNLILSGKSLYWSEFENTYYFVSQLDNNLYRIIDED